ncbi:hypothetical protein GOEFS_039_00180 [Gordonia effusa NBRC 100432]|uniref:Uncharacterized protein n=1 Tax=Gordonia effusa NBRC 100432 TaxID=1077974 RepID=H0QY83_9ACTN|nr:hypothetical protein [Gordonia effusa]GAB17784.1 hypothetical protein GOEFS_039_00180 [Gordonia effusa NBRC 100432]
MTTVDDADEPTGHVPDDSSQPTSSRELAIEWHPDALRPGFDWNVALPTDWAVLKTHPAQWRRQNERIVDDYYGGKRVAAKVRRALLKSLEDAVAVTQKNRILLTLIHPGVDAEGRIENVSLNLMFTSSSPRLASMAPIRKGLEGKSGKLDELTTPSGNAYVLVERQQQQRDGDSLRDVVSIQAFYPLPSTTWTLVIGATTPRIDWSDALRDAVIRMAGSVSWRDNQAGDPVDTASELPDPISLVSYRVPK